METSIVVRKPALPSTLVKSLLPKSEVREYKQEAFTLCYCMASVTSSWQRKFCPPKGQRPAMFCPHPHQGWAWPCCFASPLCTWQWRSASHSFWLRPKTSSWQLVRHQLGKGLPSIQTNQKNYNDKVKKLWAPQKKPVWFKMCQSLMI